MKVYIDAGHGGKDPGAVGNGMREKDINLYVGNKVAEILRGYDIEVYQSRTKDVFIELGDRSKEANKLGVDLFTSIHVNAFDGVAEGLETFVYTKASEGSHILADKVHSNLVGSMLYKKDRGIKTANFSVLRNTKMPAILVELGFIDNRREADVLRHSQDKMAESIAKGILEYLGVECMEDKVVDKKEVAEFKRVALEKCVKKYGVNYDTWINRLDEKADVWLIFELLSRI